MTKAFLDAISMINKDKNPAEDPNSDVWKNIRLNYKRAMGEGKTGIKNIPSTPSKDPFDWNKLASVAGKVSTGLLLATDFLLPEEKMQDSVVRPMEVYNPNPYGTESEAIFKNGGTIHIKKENRGKFTAAAKKAGMGVQEYASHILAHKENYSPTLVKRANFAHNASQWHKAQDGLTVEDPGLIQIKDARNRLLATGADAKKYRRSGEYSKGVIQHIAMAAKRAGLDPYTAVAMGLQESNLGRTDENYGHVMMRGFRGENYSEFAAKNKDLNQGAIDLAYMLKDKFAYAERLGYDSEVMKLQTYNGLGTISPKTEAKYHKKQGLKPNMLYGLDLNKVGPINMKKNPLYGKTIIDIRDNVIKRNPEVVQLINDTIGGKIPLAKVDDPYGRNRVNHSDTPTFVGQTPGIKTKPVITPDKFQNSMMPPMAGRRKNRGVRGSAALVAQKKSISPLIFENGGTLSEGMSYDLNPEQIKSLLDQGYEIDFE